MTELEQLKQELQRLTEKVEELEKQEEEHHKSGYPKLSERYYFVGIDYRNGEIRALDATWDNDKNDIYYWDFCHGSTDENKVKWTIEHIGLVNEIKKYTKDFEEGAENWYFYKEPSLGTYTLETWGIRTGETPNEYGYFNSQEEIDKAIEQLDEEYIFKFLFRPRNGDYKAVMDWLAEQEEE